MNRRTLSEMPEFINTQDMIELGIYQSIEAAYQARRIGVSPPFIKLMHKILYPKDLLIEWLKERTQGTIGKLHEVQVPELNRE